MLAGAAFCHSCPNTGLQDGPDCAESQVMHEVTCKPALVKEACPGKSQQPGHLLRDNWEPGPPRNDSLIPQLSQPGAA